MIANNYILPTNAKNSNQKESCGMYYLFVSFYINQYTVNAIILLWKNFWKNMEQIIFALGKFSRRVNNHEKLSEHEIFHIYNIIII